MSEPTRDVIRKVKRIELVTRRLVNPQLTGAYHSVFKGRGMNFDEVAQYNAGDDVRFIDWNVSARSGDLHVKRFVEERELTVQVLIDSSSSMRFGTTAESKRTLAAQLAAVFAVLAIRNNDRVGLTIFDHEITLHIPPKKGRKHVMRLITEVLEHRPRRSTTDLASALRHTARATSRKAILFVVSDFLSDAWEHECKLLARRHDVVPVVIEDPRERDFLPAPVADTRSAFRRFWDRLWQGGLVTLEDLETGARTTADLDPDALQGWRERTQSRIAERDRVFTRLRLDAMHFRTDFTDDADMVRPLAQYFRRRARRM
jgi:uncharacterized protein (DUF58 family)